MRLKPHWLLADPDNMPGSKPPHAGLPIAPFLSRNARHARRFKSARQIITHI